MATTPNSTRSRRWSRAIPLSDDGKQWDLTLRDGLKFHDGTPVLARDCVATIQRLGKRDPFGAALMARTDEIAAPSDKVIRFRLKKPFPLLPDALAQIYCAIMPERLAKTDAIQQVTEAVGSGPFRFVAAERVAGSARRFEKNADYVPRTDGTPSFNAGPKIVYVDRVVWNFMPDPATAAAALTQGEVDWWENPTDRPRAAAQARQGSACRGQGPHRRDRLPALQPAVPAVRQAGDPPRGAGGDRPEGVHAGGGRRGARA